jgi:hypothetical protein
LLAAQNVALALDCLGFFHIVEQVYQSQLDKGCPSEAMERRPILRL